MAPPPAATTNTPSNNGNGPPLTEIVATTEEPRKTHIEVCVRIRPLVVGKESSTSFLKQQAAGNNKGGGRSKLSSPPRSKLSSPPRNAKKSRTAGGRGGAPPQETMDRGGSSAENDGPQTYAWTCASSDTVQQAPEIGNLPGRANAYTLDHVYGPDDTTQNLYQQSVQNLVHAAMDGYHASVLAYGQTSTGKTHSMTGTSAQPGLIPLAIRGCFEYLQQGAQAREYLLRLSYMEVYKEHIRDLLAAPGPSPTPIRLFDTAADGLVIKGLKEEVVTNPEDVFRILAEGESRRQVGATNLNAHSSRSHVIVRLWIESRGIPAAAVATANDAGGGMQRLTSNASATSSIASSTPLGANVRVSSLSLVDLAGSESVKLTGSNERRAEGHYINQSLMTLGKVVNALSELGKQEAAGKKLSARQAQHIPYRDSKLTRLLQPSLSGNAQVVLVCCISPLAQHLEESHSTFKFAVRAKKIPQRATIQEQNVDGGDRTLLQSYRDEIEDLKQQLKEAQESKEQLAKAQQQSKKKDEEEEEAPPPLEDVVSEDEIKELVSSIQTMEKLILKSKPLSPSVMLQQRPEDLIDHDDPWGDDDDDDEDLLALATTSAARSEEDTYTTASVTVPSSLPTNDETVDRNLEIELSRIQGLLGSVLKKRKQHKTSGGASVHSSAASAAADSQEVLQLRAQLEQQELATAVRKADSSFLQQQLHEKDEILLEVSKLLEAVESRQSQLEKENAALRKQLAVLQQAQRESQAAALQHNVNALKDKLPTQQ